MKDRSAWWRSRAGVTAWCVLTVAAAGTAWAAVAIVLSTTGPIPVAITSTDASVSPVPPLSLSPSASPSPAVGASTRATPGAPAPAGSVSRTIRSPGGTLAVACSGGTARLVYATPAAGWRMEPDETSGDRIRVDFVKGEAGYQVSGRCKDGGVEAEVEQKSSGGDSSN